MNVRTATADDAHRCAEIYAPFVRDTAVSFEDVPPTTAEMAGRITASLQNYAWFVAEIEAGEVCGYAYATAHRSRSAYRRSCEVSVYLAESARGVGVAAVLYRQLFASLKERGFRTALAGITIPNAASEGFHRKCGFTTVGVYTAVGWKHDTWHDVLWLQKDLWSTD